MPSAEVVEIVSDVVWEVPTTYREMMLVPARIYGTVKFISGMDEAVYVQVTTVGQHCRGGKAAHV